MCYVKSNEIKSKDETKKVKLIDNNVLTNNSCNKEEYLQILVISINEKSNIDKTYHC